MSPSTSQTRTIPSISCHPSALCRLFTAFCWFGFVSYRTGVCVSEKGTFTELYLTKQPRASWPCPLKPSHSTSTGEPKLHRGTCGKGRNPPRGVPGPKPGSNTGSQRFSSPCRGWMSLLHPPADGSRGRTWLGDNQALVRRQQEEFPAGVQVQAGQDFLLAQLAEDADGPATAAVLPGTAHRPVRISLCSLGNSGWEQRVGSGLMAGASSVQEQAQCRSSPGAGAAPARLHPGRDPRSCPGSGARSPRRSLIALRSQLCSLPRLLHTKNLLPNSVSCPPHQRRIKAAAQSIAFNPFAAALSPGEEVRVPTLDFGNEW